MVILPIGNEVDVFHGWLVPGKLTASQSWQDGSSSVWHERPATK